jgi:hypothetical protein
MGFLSRGMIQMHDAGILQITSRNNRAHTTLNMHHSHSEVFLRQPLLNHLEGLHWLVVRNLPQRKRQS